MAQAVSVGSDSGVGGDTLVIPVTFTAGGDLSGIDLDITFDDSQFSAASASCAANDACAGAFTNCSVNPDGTANIIVAAGSACSTGTLGEITLTIDAAATAGDKPLTVTVVGASDSSGTDIDPASVGVTDGNAIVLGAAYASNPTPAQGVDLGSVVQGDTDPSADVDITNSGAAGTQLVGTCSILTNPTVFSVAAPGTFDIAAGATASVTVSCDSAQPQQVHNGVMTCTHNGDDTGEADPADYDLTCLITDGPHPQFNASPSTLSFEAAQAGDVMSSQQSTITNSSPDAEDTTLNSTSACVLAGTDAGQYSLSGGVTYSLLRTGGVSETSVLTISCDATVEGDYNDASVSCPHDGSNASPGIIDLSCKVNTAGAAVYGSSPVAPGGTIDFTPGDDAIVGTDPPDQTNNIENTTTDVNDNDLWVECSLSPNAAISETTDNNGFFIAPDSSRPATFTCDASTAGNYSTTYTCDYGVDGTESTGAGTATYDVVCDVSEAVSDVSVDPASGETLTTVVSTGGTGTFHVTFTENADEGVDGELIICELDDGSVFSITSPDSFPVDIPAGGSVWVTVEGTDPGDTEIIEDVLRCTYSDSDSEGTDVVYNLVMQIGEVATFTVFKDFTDENPNEVPVEISCDNGLPIRADSTVSEGSEVTFVVGSFESGELNCEIFESPAPDGYMASYAASGDSDSGTTDTSCVFTDVERGNENICIITNTPKPVDVVITKEWLFEGSFSDVINISYELTLFCDAVIIGGHPIIDGASSEVASSVGGGVWYKEFHGTGPEIFTAKVIPEYPSSDCYVVEDIFDDTVETENNCGNLVVSAGHGASCKVTNTVFFEGIPTLSQYGLAIMALLMLGVGMVGFRRFS
jgi:hypothetical protein